jgi:hypothetical protein
MAGFRRDRGSLNRVAKRKQLERDKLDATPPWQHARHDEQAATEGPYDVKDTPEDEHERVDLGALRLPVVKGIDIQAEADNEGRVSTVRLVRKGTQMQVGVFAAPRAEGIWDEIRAEIATSMTDGGGSAAEVEAERFGTELHGELAGARGAKTPVRFIGVDGPRWFVRAMIVGPGATDEAAAEPLLEVFADTVVVRGREPLPVREPVPLHLPKEELPHEDDDADDA